MGVHAVKALVVGTQLIEVLVIGGGGPIPKFSGGSAQLGDV
ncbi:hypothetical protein [Mycobacterium intracellulare]|uniref:Uncharacterized protein n=1 Tax=Mycobacterium intracellulare subsp. chimaera TaxID=222805 RepID=A0ABT7P6R7_MYCIT|nr:hypothetical protein [Mycobacterium intracellulare]MDM3928975.1 hypothetical protein [Mycobacterium intracellulare subsp. chimaera]